MLSFRRSRTLIGVLVTSTLWCLGCGVCLAGRNDRISVGGGVSLGSYGSDVGTIDDSRGLYAVLLYQAGGGWMGHLALSFGDFDGRGPSGAIDIGTLRMGLSAGYVFRRQRNVRPFVSGGLAMLSLSSPSMGGGAIVEDSTGGLTLGLGVMATGGRHGAYLDLSYDHAMDVNTFSAGTFEFDYTEVRVGYLWSSR